MSQASTLPPLNIKEPPMKVVMFLPWPDESFQGTASEYINGAQARQGKYERKAFYNDDNTRKWKWRTLGKRHKSIGKKIYHLRELHKFQTLEDLCPCDRLYILGHGIEDDKERLALIKGDYPQDRPLPGYSVYQPLSSNRFYPALTPDQLVTKLHVAKLPVNVTDIRLWVCKSGDDSFSTFAWEFAGLIRKRNKTAIVTAYSGFMTLTHIGEKRGDFEQGMASGLAAKNFRIVINNTDAFKNYEPDLDPRKLTKMLQDKREAKAQQMFQERAEELKAQFDDNPINDNLSFQHHEFDIQPATDDMDDYGVPLTVGDLSEYGL